MTGPFWRALDSVPAATTDLRDWRELLGDHYSACTAFLVPRGALAKELACPSPGGDGCPRQVVATDDGRFRAVCGQRPAECETLDLSRSDLTLFAVDRIKLAKATAAAFGAQGHIRDHGDWLALGRLPVSAGAGINVALVLPRDPERLPSVGHDLEPAQGWAVVVPTMKTLPEIAIDRLVACGNVLVALSDVASVQDSGTINLHSDPYILLSQIRDRLLKDERETRLWALPSDARWGELLFELINDDVVNVSFRNHARRFEPHDFGLSSPKKGRPKLAWAILQAVCIGNGVLPRGLRDGSKKDPAKQKQLLSAVLKEAFGIDGEPIPWIARDGFYLAKFLARDERSKLARDAGRRKFAGD